MSSPSEDFDAQRELALQALANLKQNLCSACISESHPYWFESIETLISLAGRTIMDINRARSSERERYNQLRHEYDRMEFDHDLEQKQEIVRLRARVQELLEANNREVERRRERETEALKAADVCNAFADILLERNGQIRRLEKKLSAQLDAPADPATQLCQKCHQPQQMNKAWVVGEGHMFIEGCVDALGLALRKIGEVPK